MSERRRASTPRRGRSLAELAADFGYSLPVPAPVAVLEEQPGEFDTIARRRGRFARYAGWTAVPAPLPVFRMTSDQVGAVWPWIATSGVPPTGARMGIDLLSGGEFYSDPIGWVTDPEMPVTNPNIVVFGKPGQGKSGTIKMFCLRMLEYTGYRVLILGDPKDEYEKLCRLLGVEPIIYGTGHPARINPLDYGPLFDGWAQLDGVEQQRRADATFGRWITLVRGLVGSRKVNNEPVPFTPSDEETITAVLHDLTGYRRGNTHLAETTIPQVWQALAEPHTDLIAARRYESRPAFLRDTRLLADTLGTLVHGHLAGLFDEKTNIDIDWRAPIASLSLSRLKGDEAIGIALMCLNSWGTGMREVAEPGDIRIIVRDEAWKQMRLGLEPVKALDESLRLSRGGTHTTADVQIIAAHKPSDMLSVGAAGSQAATIAKDLIHLCDTKILLGQDAGVADELANLLELEPKARNIVTDWAMGGTGRALWRVGTRAFQVASVRTRIEETLTWTNDALTGAS